MSYEGQEPKRTVKFGDAFPAPGKIAWVCSQKLGWRVVPGNWVEKRPIIPDWPNVATTDADQLQTWWGQLINADVCVVTGRESGIWVVDVDRLDALDELEERYGKLPESFRVRTLSGGLHVYLRYPAEGEIVTRARAFGVDGVDVRGWHGQVIAPMTMGSYVPLTDVNVEAAPDAWVEAARKPERGERTSDEPRDTEPLDAERWVEDAALVPGGAQEDYLFRGLCSLWARNTDPADMRAAGYRAVERFKQTKKEPWTRGDVDYKVEKITERYEPGGGGVALEDWMTGWVTRFYDDRAFWEERDELRVIRDYARAQHASPWAVLGAVFARIMCCVPPRVVLPATIHSESSLNLAVALVGPSGSGKGGAQAVAANVVNLDSARGRMGDVTLEPFDEHTLGTGQGITRGYAYWSTKDKQLVRVAESVLFTVEEVDHIAAHAAQNASTVLSEFRRMWMGEKLGFLYADPTKRIQLPAHSYRAGLIVGVQPTRAGALLDDAAGGTPQRFLWFLSYEPDAPDADPERPEPVKWEPPDFNLGSELRPLVIPDVAVEAIRRASKERQRGEGNPLDGHRLLTKLKVAAALALLTGRADVTEDDWRLAQQVMRASDHAREVCVQAVRQDRRTRNVERGRAEGTRAAAAARTVEDDATQEARRKLLDKLRKASGAWVMRSELRSSSLPPRLRHVFDPAIAGLADAGLIEPEEHEYKGRTVQRFRALGS